jgi:aryl-alcohol dehydrogenase-like predicted oxidoreductase
LRIALGTAQFGLSYGIANSEGQISQSSALEILEYCKFIGLDTLDTAIAYGESEQCLGSVGVTSFNVITKLPSIPEDCEDIENWIMEEVNASIFRLNGMSLYGLMLHRPEQLLGPYGQEIMSALCSLKKLGIVQKIGISVYSPDEFTALFSEYDFDIVQCPFNLIDRRLVNSGWLEKLKLLGVEVHVRSSFLQGLLLMPRDKIPDQFRAWDSLWDDWHEWLVKHAVSPVDACIAYVLSHCNIDQVVVGVDSKLQLEQIVSAIECNSIKAFPDINSLDSNLINPNNWKTT